MPLRPWPAWLVRLLLLALCAAQQSDRDLREDVRHPRRRADHEGYYGDYYDDQDGGYYGGAEEEDKNPPSCPNEADFEMEHGAEYKCACSNDCGVMYYGDWYGSHEDGECVDSYESVQDTCPYGSDCADCGYRVVSKDWEPGELPAALARPPASPSPPASPPTPPSYPTECPPGLGERCLCTNECFVWGASGEKVDWTGDVWCDDESTLTTCPYGSDCLDCGIRVIPESPGAPPPGAPPFSPLPSSSVVVDEVPVLEVSFETTQAHEIPTTPRAPHTA